MDLCLRILRGIDASSPILRSSRMKNTTSTQKLMNRAMITGELHGNLWPPHCIARNRVTMAEINKTLPPRSRGKRKCFKPPNSSDAFFGCSFKNIETSRNTMVPRGRLLYCQRVQCCRGNNLHPKAPSPDPSISERTTENRSDTNADAKDAHK